MASLYYTTASVSKLIIPRIHSDQVDLNIVVYLAHTKTSDKYNSEV